LEHVKPVNDIPSCVTFLFFVFIVCVLCPMVTWRYIKSGIARTLLIIVKPMQYYAITALERDQYEVLWSREQQY
jgi:hypothetical protein